MQGVFLGLKRLDLAATARRNGPDFTVLLSTPVTGTTLTSAPVSTKKRLFVTLSSTKTRQSFRPATVAITCGWPGLLLATHKGLDISWLPFPISSDKNSISI